MLTIPVFLAVTAAYMVKGMCGFANTLVFGTLAGFFTDNVNISPVDLLLGYPSNLCIAWTERKGIRPKIWIPLSLLVIAGSIPGVFFLKTGDARTIKILFGFVVVFLGLEMFLRERKASGSGTPGSEKSASPALLVIIGLLSGILCGLFGVSALLVAYVRRTARDQIHFRANNCMVFLAEKTVRLFLYGSTGILTLEAAKTALCLAPFMVLGLFIGIFFHRRLPERTARLSVTVLLMVSGLSLILDHL